jgi:hypothetical protein
MVTCFFWLLLMVIVVVIMLLLLLLLLLLLTTVMPQPCNAAIVVCNYAPGGNFGDAETFRENVPPAVTPR